MHLMQHITHHVPRPLVHIDEVAYLKRDDRAGRKVGGCLGLVTPAPELKLPTRTNFGGDAAGGYGRLAVIFPTVIFRTAFFAVALPLAVPFVTTFFTTFFAAFFFFFTAFFVGLFAALSSYCLILSGHPAQLPSDSQVSLSEE